MSKWTIAFVVAFAPAAANAQNAGTEPSRASNVAGVNDTRPFLFDGRMRGDGSQGRVFTEDHRPGAGVVVMPPKEPARER